MKQEIEWVSEMKRNRKKAGIILTAVLLLAILIFAGGNIYLYQSLKAVREEKLAAAEEREALEKKIEKLEKEEETLHKEVEEEKEKTKQEQTEKKEENEEALPDTSEDEEDKAAESSSKSTEESDNIKLVLDAHIAERVGTGEDWQVYVKRLSDGLEVSAGSGQMRSASLIKLYIMGAVYSHYDEIVSANGKETVDGLLSSMITVSDNDSANSLTGMLGKGDPEAGKAVVNDYCTQNGYKDTSMGRMLLESNANGENYTSASDCGKFLEGVYNETMPHSAEMMSLLKQQERTGKIPAGIPDGIETANKTGELDVVENDAAIIFNGNAPYILCVLSDNVSDAAGARENIKNLSADIYKNISTG